MKVLLVNGSPKKDGNTATALAEVARELDACGIESEVFQLGAGPIRDCIGCGGCAGKGRCVFADDVVNDLIDAAEGADGFVFGSPVYYAHPSGRILSALDRAFYAGGAAFAHNFGLAGAAASAATAEKAAVLGGPSVAGQIVLVCCIAVLFVIAIVNVRKQKNAA